MIGLGAMTGGVLVAQTGINRWFSEHKGLAITLVHTGGTLGGFVAARVLDKVIRTFNGNWRAGWWVIAGVSTICAVLAMLFVREQPADLGQFPDGATAQEAAASVRSEHANAPVHKTNEDWTLLDALKHAFALADSRLPSGLQRRLSALYRARQRAFARSGIHARSGGIVDFDHAALRDVRHAILCRDSRSDRAAPELGGRLAGFRGGNASRDTRERRCQVSISTRSCWAGSFGVCFSAMMVLPANYYGVKGYPPVISLMMVVGTTAGAVGATLAGIVFDRFHSYTSVFYCVATLSVLSAIVLLLMKPARKPASSLAATAPEQV